MYHLRIIYRNVNFRMNGAIYYLDWIAIQVLLQPNAEFVIYFMIYLIATQKLSVDPVFLLNWKLKYESI